MPKISAISSADTKPWRIIAGCPIDAYLNIIACSPPMNTKRPSLGHCAVLEVLTILHCHRLQAEGRLKK
jgi:hypothetical protein